MAVELTEAGRKARAAYLREYRKRNKERLKDNAVTHWNKVGAQMEAEEAAKKGKKQEGTSTGSASNE